MASTSHCKTSPQEFCKCRKRNKLLLQIDQTPVQPLQDSSEDLSSDATEERSLGDIKKITFTYSSLSSYKLNHHTANVLPIPQDISMSLHSLKETTIYNH